MSAIEKALITVLVMVVLAVVGLGATVYLIITR